MTRDRTPSIGRKAFVGNPIGRGAVRIALSGAGAIVAWALAMPAAAAPAGPEPAAPPRSSTSPDAQQNAPGDRPLPGAPENRQSAPGETGVKPQEQAATGLFDRAFLLGDPGGLRAQLERRGLTFGAAESIEVFGNATGGTRRSVDVEGLAQFGIGIDTERAFGLPGGTFNVSALQIHGRGLSASALDNNLSDVSGIEASRATVLFELWYEQTVLQKTLAVRVGQQSADQEFMISQYANLFLNSTFGYPNLPSFDLPSGSPTYPLGTPAVRLRYVPRDDAAFLLGIFNGDPAGARGFRNPQGYDQGGTAFRLHDGVLAIGEVQYAHDRADGATGLPGTVKLGGYYDTQTAYDQRLDARGNPLPPSANIDALGRARGGNWALYGIADQLLARRDGTRDGGLGAFVRVMGAPGDRNLVNVYVDAGLTYKGLSPTRDSDTLGLGVAFTRISDTASKRDSDTARLLGTPYPVRRNETVLELTYQVQLAPWWQVQPSAQYVFNINGGVPDPLQPAKRLRDAAVFGLRSNVAF